MKAMMIVILLTLVGCAAKPSAPETFDSRASEYRLELMVKCGEVAAMLGDGDQAMADKLYGQCLYDMNLTI